VTCKHEQEGWFQTAVHTLGTAAYRCIFCERDALIQSCKTGDEAIARLEGEKEAMMQSGDRAYLAVKELRADLAAERARTDALVEAVKDEWACGNGAPGQFAIMKRVSAAIDAIARARK
jgi:hypothetical protein